MDFSGIYLEVIGLIFLGTIVVTFVIPKFFSRKCKSKMCLVGKTALVTGGSLGIGYEIVMGLAQRGCRVIVADKVIHNDIKNKIIQETGNTEVYFEYVDLASFHSVRCLAEKIKKTEKTLDVLINNAGIGKSFGVVTGDGINLTMQVNYYSPFLLTHLLVDTLKNSPSARVLFCSSPIVTSFAKFLIKGASMETTFGDYRLSKFCVLVAAEIFAERLKCHNITSNSFHPGSVNTGIHKQFFEHKVMNALIKKFGGWFFKNPEDGAQTAIYLACAREVQNVTGTFFADLEPICKPKDLFNKRLCENIWDASEKVVKLKKEELL